MHNIIYEQKNVKNVTQYPLNASFKEKNLLYFYKIIF